MTHPIHLIAFTIIACVFIVFGFYGDGYIHKLSLILGGVYLGHILTEALNYDETANQPETQTTQGI